MDLDIRKLAQGLSGVQRAKLLIQHFHSKDGGKSIFNPSDEEALLYTPNQRFDRECWYILELYRWAGILWYKEIPRIWQVYLLTMQNVATMRTLPDDIKEYSFVMLDKPELAVQASHSLRELIEYELVIAEVEKLGDGTPLFDEATGKTFKDWTERAKQLQLLNNTWVDDFKLADNLKIVDLPPRTEFVTAYVEEVKRIANFFVDKRKSQSAWPL